jgi:hypothetical protein
VTTAGRVMATNTRLPPGTIWKPGHATTGTRVVPSRAMRRKPGTSERTPGVTPPYSSGRRERLPSMRRVPSVRVAGSLVAEGTTPMVDVLLGVPPTTV